jgi:hypothetical protein
MEGASEQNSAESPEASGGAGREPYMTVFETTIFYQTNLFSAV